MERLKGNSVPGQQWKRVRENTVVGGGTETPRAQTIGAEKTEDTTDRACAWRGEQTTSGERGGSDSQLVLRLQVVMRGQASGQAWWKSLTASLSW